MIASVSSIARCLWAKVSMSVFNVNQMIRIAIQHQPLRAKSVSKGQRATHERKTYLDPCSTTLNLAVGHFQPCGE